MTTSTTTYCLLAALAGLAAAQDQPTELHLKSGSRGTAILVASDENGKSEVRTFDVAGGPPGGGGEGGAMGFGAVAGAAIPGMPAETVPTFEARDLAEPVRWAIRQHADIFEEPLRTGPVTFLGVSAIPVPHELAVHLPLPEDTGLGVEGLVPDSPAAKAGLEKSDVLMKLDGQILIHPRQLSVLVANHKEGDSVKLTYLRKGEVKEVTVTLAKREVEPGEGTDQVFYDASFGHKAPLRTYLRHFDVPGGAGGHIADMQKMKEKLSTHVDELRNNVDFHKAKAAEAHPPADPTLSLEVRRAAEAAYAAEVQRAARNELKRAEVHKDAAEAATKIEIDELRTKLDAVLKLLEEKK